MIAMSWRVRILDGTGGGVVDEVVVVLEGVGVGVVGEGTGMATGETEDEARERRRIRRKVLLGLEEIVVDDFEAFGVMRDGETSDVDEGTA